MFTAASVTRVSITVNSTPLAPNGWVFDLPPTVKGMRMLTSPLSTGSPVVWQALCYSYNHVCSVGIGFLPGGGGGGTAGRVCVCKMEGQKVKEGLVLKWSGRVCVFSCLFLLLLEYDVITGRFFCSDDYYNSEGFFFCVCVWFCFKCESWKITQFWCVRKSHYCDVFERDFREF